MHVLCRPHTNQKGKVGVFGGFFDILVHNYFTVLLYIVYSRPSAQKHCVRFALPRSLTACSCWTQPFPLYLFGNFADWCYNLVSSTDKGIACADANALPLMHHCSGGFPENLLLSISGSIALEMCGNSIIQKFYSQWSLQAVCGGFSAFLNQR